MTLFSISSRDETPTRLPRAQTFNEWTQNVFPRLLLFVSG
jgi:hypothetical protein